MLIFFLEVILSFYYALYWLYPSNIKMAWESTGCFLNNSPIGYRNIDIYLKSIKQIQSSRISSLQKQLHKMYTFGPTRDSSSKMRKELTIQNHVAYKTFWHMFTHSSIYLIGASSQWDTWYREECTHTQSLWSPSLIKEYSWGDQQVNHEVQCIVVSPGILKSHFIHVRIYIMYVIILFLIPIWLTYIQCGISFRY